MSQHSRPRHLLCPDSSPTIALSTDDTWTWTWSWTWAWTSTITTTTTTTSTTTPTFTSTSTSTSTVLVGAGVLLCALLLVFGCDRERSTQTPGGAGSDPGSRVERTQEGRGGEGETGDAKQALPTVRDRDPEEEKRKMAASRKHSGQARGSLQRGALDSAIEQARQALRVHEQNVDAMLVIAEAFYRQGKYGLTQAVTSSALAVDPKIRTPQETSRAHNLMGFALIALGNDAQATDAFRKAAETDENNAAAWNNLGTRYLDAGDVDTALGCFEYALELKPSFAKAHVNHGAALRAKKRWQDAEKALMHALRLKKNYAEAYFNLGVLYLDADPFPGLDTMKRLNKAIASLTKYRELATSGPAASSSAKGAASKGAASLGPSVSRERADDYIRVAKKGIEREERRLEREKDRQGKDAAASDGNKPSKPSGKASTSTSQSQPDEDVAEESSAPRAKPSETQAPASRPSEKQPSETPSEKKPSETPSEKPSETPSEKKPSEKKPSDEPSEKPAEPPSAPTPRKPSVQRPGGAS